MRKLSVIVLLLTALACAAPAPLQIISMTARGTGLPNNPALDQVNGTMVVRNTSRHAVSGVVMLIHIADRNGNPITTLRKAVGTLAAGQSATFPWSWYNYTLIAVRPEGEVVYHVHGGAASITGQANYAAPPTVTQQTAPGYGSPNNAPEHPAPGYGTP